MASSFISAIRPRSLGGNSVRNMRRAPLQMLQARPPVRSSSPVIHMAARIWRRSPAMGCCRASRLWHFSSTSMATMSMWSSSSMICWASTRSYRNRASVALATASPARAASWTIRSLISSISAWKPLRVCSVMVASLSRIVR